MVGSSAHPITTRYTQPFLSEGDLLLLSWNQLLAQIPPGFRVIINGPRFDGGLTLSINPGRHSRTIMSFSSRSLSEAIQAAVEGTKVMNSTQPRSKGKFTKKEPLTDAVVRNLNQALKTPEGREAFDLTMEAMGAPDPIPGFTRDRDLVAYLVYKNGRVSQYELRHVHGIKNPAQSINDAELLYHFTMQTGEALPNGDIPYRLIGAAPAIAGTMPMFQNGVEDPDGKLYVMELDLYSCSECGRHPVYRPQHMEDAYAGVCPRHGAATFTRL